jgi:DNA-binding FadR family transcriptional regulator
MCGNSMLAQCCALVEDQAQWARRAAFARAEYRQLEVEHSQRLVAAVVDGDGEGAAAAMKAYVDAVRFAD